MLIEQIIEFELKGPGPLNRTCPKLVIFVTKQKSFKEDLRVDFTGLLFTAKILQEAMYLTSPYSGQISCKI